MNIPNEPDEQLFSPKQYKAMAIAISAEVLILVIIAILFFQKYDPIIALAGVILIAIGVGLLDVVIFFVWRLVDMLKTRPDEQEVPAHMYGAYKKFSVVGVVQIVLLALMLPAALVPYLLAGGSDAEGAYTILAVLALFTFAIGVISVVYAVSFAVFKSKNKPTGKSWSFVKHMFVGSIVFSVVYFPVALLAVSSWLLSAL